MLTLEEVLSDVAMSPGFNNVEKVSVDSRGDDGQSPLHWMATLGDAVGIRLLVEAGASINAIDNKGSTPLHEAVVWRHTLAARELIEQDADVLLRNTAGLTPLDIAKSDGFGPTIELLMLKAPGPRFNTIR